MMMNLADWLKANYTSIIDWVLAAVGIIAPVVLSKQRKDKIIHRKNAVKEYIAFTIKISFFYFVSIHIVFWLGNFLHISDYVGWLNKKRYLIFCMMLSSIFSLIAGEIWARRVKIQEQRGKHRTVAIMVACLIFLQFVFYMVAVIMKISFFCWGFLWTLLNSAFVVIGTRKFDGHDFFECEKIFLYLKDSKLVHTILPDTIYTQGNWIVVDEDMNNRVKYPTESINKIHYVGREMYKSAKAVSNRDKILRLGFSVWYFFVIGLASQFLFRSVIVPIAVTESQIVLEKGSYYQIEAVSLNSDCGQLQYDIQGDEAINVTSSGLIIVSKELPEEESLAAEIQISDELGNTATVQVEVKT